MAWFVLTDGVPPEPSYDELLSGRDQPQPLSLLARLFQELTGTAMKRSRTLVHERGSYEEVARGYCGDRNAGYVWDYVAPVNDTSLPNDETYVTYGLPTATLIWAVAYRKRGQLGYATWTCSYLHARFVGDGRDIVERVWTEVCGVAPVFVPAQPQAAQAYEDFARRREERFRADLRPGR